jgi:Ubiquitin-conjugating enzyme
VLACCTFCDYTKAVIAHSTLHRSLLTYHYALVGLGTDSALPYLLFFIATLLLFDNLLQLLQEPHAENPLEPDIAKLLQEDRAEFNKQAAKYTADFAS